MNYNLPESYQERMKELLQEEFEAYIASFEQPYHTGLRVNNLKLSQEEFTKISPYALKPVPWTNNGFYYDSEEQPAKHPYYYAGLYYIQEPSAMTPASYLPVYPGDKVLDLCAAPGGKTTELAAKLQGEGLLVSNDISASRAKALLKNIELAGVKNAIVTTDEPKKLAKCFAGYFDKILVDAPCSGEGMFRKDHGLIKSWEEYGVEYFAKIQREIIVQAADMLKPDGMMIYSTCTFSPEENEATIQHLLNERPEFSVVEIPDAYEGFAHGRPEWVNGDEQLKHCLRLFPHKIEGEGHFVALLQKNGGDTPKVKERRYKNVALTDECKEFLDEIKIDSIKNNLELIENRLYSMPDGFVETKGIRILRSGLYLGEIKKKRFEPSQSLAMAMKKDEYGRVIDLQVTDERVRKYLKGETITIDGDHENGWQLVCVDGYPLGWGKLTNQTLKNKYFPGWRLL
ncbi:tRNA and rRNA cytosine-C5-methylases [Lachnospiraceae bacterium KM106-2]|nr:tRNA and rRNA cytosine-C5-methylases [Lachnospiraceae bacterium KM106-2]